MTHRLSFLLLIMACSPLAVWAQDKADPAKPAYANNDDGLKKLMEDIVAAKKAGDKEKVSRLYQGLLVPNYEAWFKKTFGEEKGVKTAVEYKELTAKFEEDMNKWFDQILEKGGPEIQVTHVEKADDPEATGAQKTALAAMKQPIALYTARFAPAQIKLWSFAYIDGGFRLVGKMRMAK